jgi:predicted flap endonuclease-1-like 5' DNA nuclease
MSFILVVVYAAIAIYVIWWALSGAKKLDAGHGDHSHDNQPVEAHSRPASTQDADDLTRIKGIGAVITAKLRTLGFTTYDQIAALNETDIEKINTALNFKGRIDREQWIQQAREILARRS